MHSIVKGMFCVALMGFAAGCTTTPPGTTAVPASEVRTMLAGNTWGWPSSGPGGGIYFNPDGTAEIFHQGELWNTTWSTRNGAFCYQHPEGDRCWGMYRRDGVLVSRSHWQEQWNEPYDWNYESEVRRGRHLG